MSWTLLLTLALAPVALLSVRELRKASRSGIFEDGGDWDIRLDDEPGLFGSHYLLMVAPIFGFLTLLTFSLMEFFE